MTDQSAKNLLYVFSSAYADELGDGMVNQWQALDALRNVTKQMRAEYSGFQRCIDQIVRDVADQIKSSEEFLYASEVAVCFSRGCEGTTPKASNAGRLGGYPDGGTKYAEDKAGFNPTPAAVR